MLTDHLFAVYGGVAESMPVNDMDITTGEFIEQVKARFSITRDGWRLIRDDDGSEVPQGALLRVLSAHPSGVTPDLMLVLAPRVWR